MRVTTLLAALPGGQAEIRNATFCAVLKCLGIEHDPGELDIRVCVILMACAFGHIVCDVVCLVCPAVRRARKFRAEAEPVAACCY
jgi:hypothetical protein